MLCVTCSVISIADICINMEDTRGVVRLEMPCKFMFVSFNAVSLIVATPYYID